jgi:hypothetical protein
MKRLKIDFDDIQKAMEDIARDAFEYFLDIETGDVLILSEDIINRAKQILDESYEDDFVEYEEVEFDEEQDIPEWMEDEIELALNIFLHEPDRYVRIPERDSRNGYAVMSQFTEGLDNEQLRKKLRKVIDGKGAFRRFKEVLEPYPKARKEWYKFNAHANRKVIEGWLRTLGIKAAPARNHR